MNLSGDYALYSDVNQHIPLYTNIRLVLLSDCRTYSVTWAELSGNSSTANINAGQADAWVRDGVWILKFPATVRLPIGI